MNYSVAIRTLGTSPVLREELESLAKQTKQPDAIYIYLADGYPCPSFRVGREEYIYVKKGMVAQRALPYKEVRSDYLLLLDDDVVLADDSIEKMLSAIRQYDADCVGADTFQNHLMSLSAKLYAALTNLVVPHYDNKWAFKIHSNGSFSYINNPTKNYYRSQSCAGPASLWKTSVLRSIHLEDEIWMDEMEFSWGDDALEFYKLFKNGYHLGVLFNSGIKNLDAKSASSSYHIDLKKYYKRSYASHVLWRRMIYDCECHSLFSKSYACITYSIKVVWLFFVNIVAGLIKFKFIIPYYYAKGIVDAMRFVDSENYKCLPKYLLS